MNLPHYWWGSFWKDEWGTDMEHCERGRWEEGDLEYILVVIKQELFILSSLTNNELFSSKTMQLIRSLYTYLLNVELKQRRQVITGRWGWGSKNLFSRRTFQHCELILQREVKTVRGVQTGGGFLRDWKEQNKASLFHGNRKNDNNNYITDQGDLFQ